VEVWEKKVSSKEFFLPGKKNKDVKSHKYFPGILTLSDRGFGNILILSN